MNWLMRGGELAILKEVNQVLVSLLEWVARFLLVSALYVLWREPWMGTSWLLLAAAVATLFVVTYLRFQQQGRQGPKK